MTKRKTPELTQQHAINPSTNNKIEDGGENEVTEVVVASPARTSKRQQRQVVKYKDDSSDFEEEEKKKKAKKKPKKEPKARQQIVAFFNKTDGETDTPKPQATPSNPPANPPSPPKSPKKSPKKSPTTKKKNTSKSPPGAPLPQPSKLHPFFASKEERAALDKERAALEKEREAAELKQREEQLKEKERLLAELEQRNKANPPAPIFLTKEQKIKKKLEKERDVLLDSVRKSREETARLSEGKEAHPFLLPRAFERPASEKGEDRSSGMLIHQIKLPYFPDIPHVLQESPTPKESQLCDTNGHLAARTRVRDRVRAAAHAEVPSVHGIALDKCASLNIIPHFLEMMSIPKATVPKYKEKVRSCKIKNKTIADDMRALEEEGAKKVPPIDGSLLLANCKAKHLNFCSEENPGKTTEENPLWTETYRPQNSAEILGNKDCVTLLHSWLEKWRDKEERRWAKAQAKTKPKLKRLKRDKGDKLCNAMLLVGPHGAGKTATVYAVAKELGFEIIETNASCRRTGKQLTELFGEATKSHQLQITAEEGSSTRFTHSMILVEEADIQHEDDKGFLPTLTQLATTTKRPFVFVCNEVTPAIKQLREVTGLCTINFTVPQAPLITYSLRAISATEGAFTEEHDVADMINWLGCDIRFFTPLLNLRQSLLNLQFWTQSCLLAKGKQDSYKLPTVAVHNKWLGFGEFERKYSGNLWVMLECSAQIRQVPSEAGTPKGTRKKRNSTGKGKRGKAKDPDPTIPTVPYDSFRDDQERFLSHSLSLGLDFVFLHYLALLSSPYFLEDLFIPIANKATQPTCTIDENNTTNLQTTDVQPQTLAPNQPTTNGPTTNTTTDEQIQTDNMDTTNHTPKPDPELISDNSNDSSTFASSQDSQPAVSTPPPPAEPSSQSSQSSQTLQPQQPTQTRVVYVEKDSEEFRMALIGCAALDAMAGVADTLSLRDLLSGRDVRQDLTEYIDEKEDERVKEKQEVIVTCPSYRKYWPNIPPIPFDEALITSLSTLSLRRIHSTQHDVNDQLASDNLPHTSSDLSQTTSDLSRTSSNLSRTTSDLSRTTSDLLTPASQPTDAPLHLSSQDDVVMPPNETAKLQPTLTMTRNDGLLLHTREHEQWKRMDTLIEPLPVTARLSRHCMAVEYLPYIQKICDYENLRKKSNPKRRDRFRHYLGIEGTEFQQRIQEFSMNRSTCK